MSTPSAPEARAALVAAGVTGVHRSHLRSDNIAKIHALTVGDDENSFGLPDLPAHTPEEILGLMSELTGCPAEIDDVECDDFIDPDRTVAAILAAAQRLRQEAIRGARLLAVTGHPSGLLDHHIRVVDAYRSAGGKPVTPGEDVALPVSHYGRSLRFRYVGGVGCVTDGANVLHRHRSDAMEALLDAYGDVDVVLADHGFAGAAIQRDIPTIAVMDINDAALAVASARGHDVILIPMDDNRPPRAYEPAWRLIEQVLGDG